MSPIIFLVVGLLLLYLAATNKLYAIVQIILTNVTNASGSGGGKRGFK